MGLDAGRYVRAREAIRPNAALWLVNFAQADLRALSSEESRNLRDELTLFSLPLAYLAPGTWMGDRALSRFVASNRLTPQRTARLQSEVRNGFDRLLNGQQWVLPSLRLHRILVRTDPNGKIQGGHAGGNFRDQFLMATADLLEKVGDRIKRCPECGRLFGAVRRQAYCSPRCSLRVRTRRYRNKHRDALRAKRRARYAAMIRVTHGPRVKVQARKAW